jgi:hypothetical protein
VSPVVKRHPSFGRNIFNNIRMAFAVLGYSRTRAVSVSFLSLAKRIR